MTGRTVAVTGGNGTVGRGVLAHLADAGYRTVNVSRGDRREDHADAYERADVTDQGMVYGALAKHDPDAVVHLAAVPTPVSDPGHVVFESNAMGTYHGLEAATGLGVDRVVVASSLSALGAGFEPDPVDVRYLPVDEEHPLTPSNPYGLAKQVTEVTADGFARRAGAPSTIASLRFPWVATDDDFRETFVETDRTLSGIRENGFFQTARNTLFSYLHREDAARLVRRAIEAEFDGHEVFFASAPDTTTETPTPTVVDEVYAGVEIDREFSGHEPLIDDGKAREVLGWKPRRSWRDQ